MSGGVYHIARLALVGSSLVLSCSDAFVPSPGLVNRKLLFPSFRNNQKDKHTFSEDAFDDSFLDALKPKTGGGDDDNIPEVEPDSQGGSYLKKIMEQKAAAAASAPRPIDNPFLNDTPPPPPPPQPAAEGGMPSTDAMEDLTVEEQAKMFRVLMQQSQSGVHAAPVPYEAPPPTKADPRGGRPVGRNRDADAIANTSDVYFAQLKRDSTTRTAARRAGDDDTANAVFKDGKIKELESLLRTNPHLQNQGEMEKTFLDIDGDAIQAELLKPFVESQELDEQTKSFSGISYKEKLAAKRKAKAAAAGGTVATSAPAPAPAPAPAAEPETVTPPPVPAAEPTNPMPAAFTEMEEEKVDLPKAPEPIAAQATPATTTTSTPSSPVVEASPDEVRSKLRTFMGLLLKHRGGPGFGSGVLKGPEADRFENLFEEISAIMKEEALYATPADVPMTAVPEQPPVTSQPPVQLAQPVQPVQPAEPVQPVQPVQSAQPVQTVQAQTIPPTHPHSPSAITTTMESDGQSGSQQVDNMVACIDGAIQMYRNSPPELQEGVLVTLRSALMAAVNTCNKAIAENELANYQLYNQQAAAATAGTAPPQQQQAAEFYDAQVVPPPPQPQQAAPAAPVETSTPPAPAVPMGTDANTKLLKNVYDIVQNAAGDGKYGIRNDLSADEASDMLNQIQDMRHLLMDELDNGIPDPEPSSAAAEETGGGTVSKYEQMLAKARAKKAAE